MWWVALYIVVSYVIVSSWQKLLADEGARRRALFCQYVACFVSVIVVAPFFGGAKLDKEFMIVLGIGLMNGFAAYCQWQAIAVSLSKNSLFSFFDHCIALLLDYVILGEMMFLNPMLIAGTVLSIGVAICFAIHDYPRQVNKEDVMRAKLKSAGVARKLPPHSLFFYVAWYSVLWGVAIFSLRYFAAQNVGAFQFIVPWYAGALIAASFLYFFRDRNETMPDGSPIVPLGAKDLIARFVFGGLVALCLAIQYRALEYTPQAVMQPILLVAEMLIPAAAGLYLFREREKLDSGEWRYFAVGILGVLLAAAGYITQ